MLQTPGLWIDEGAEQGSPHQRSASWGSADHLKEVDSPVVTPAHRATVCCICQGLRAEYYTPQCSFAGQPADHTDLLGLQLCRPQSKFNLLVPSCFPLNCNLACHYLLLFLKDGAAASVRCDTATLFPLYDSALLLNRL